MTEVFSGAMIGLLMGSIFITVAMLTLFFIVKEPPPRIQPLLEKFSPGSIAMSIVAVSYPLWSVVGGVLGFLYGVSLIESPGGGIGSPNLTFTLIVIATGGLLIVPALILFRKRALIGVLTVGIMFTGIFGWLLPHFAA